MADRAFRVEAATEDRRLTIRNPTNPVGCATPTELRSKAQGCCTQLPWGLAAITLTSPTGLRQTLRIERRPEINNDDSRQFDAVRVGAATRDGRNPFGVGELLAAFPRVAEYSNPGLEDGSPSRKRLSSRPIFRLGRRTVSQVAGCSSLPGETLLGSFSNQLQAFSPCLPGSTSR